MIYGHARLPTDGHSIDAQVGEFRAIAGKVFREAAPREPQFRVRL